ncbi:Hypothetical predicted protein [Olea europaea subsp. europaea]|uniref:Uncharacterized protein n=1 Tax=Olea europaea subsp. europaea TaxID=158383 RepID=A0A8S0V9L7_OLEEU|nr:Hypothetical predicted protein [Olea europaea subsp. europaea]
MTRGPKKKAVRSRRPEVITEMSGRAAIGMVRTLRILMSPIVTDPVLVRTPVEETGHVTSECRSLQEFIAALVAPASPTIAAAVTGTEIAVGILGSLLEDVYGGHVEPCPDEQDMLVDIVTPQDGAHIAPYEDDVIKPVAVASEEIQYGEQIDPQFGVPNVNDAGAMKPSNVARDDDEEADGCDATDGDGLRRRGEGEENKEVLVAALPGEHDDGLVLVFAL